jgi:hypothetical protein
MLLRPRAQAAKHLAAKMGMTAQPWIVGETEFLQLLLECVQSMTEEEKAEACARVACIRRQGRSTIWRRRNGSKQFSGGNSDHFLVLQAHCCMR